MNSVEFKVDLSSLPDNRIVIVAPHVDDILYGAYSWVEEAINLKKPLYIVYLSSGVNQEKRFSAVRKYIDDKTELFNESDFHFLRLDVFQDGRSDSANLVDAAKNLDLLFSGCDTIIIPEISNHQDHKFTNEACMISLRYRNSLSTKRRVYAYSYIYNHEFIEPNVFKSLSKRFLESKIELLSILHKVDNVLKDEVNSIEVIESMARVSGAKIPSEFGESFRLVIECQ